jgi:cell division septation protein DedD
MKDKQISEEELYDELDTMYRRVVDLEGKEAAPGDRSGPRECKGAADKPASPHEEVILLPREEILAMPGKPFKRKSRQNEKWSYRRIFMITMSVPLILLAFILIITLVKVMIASRGPNSDHIQSSTRATPSELKGNPSALPSVQTEQKAAQEIEAKEEKAESVSQGIMKPDNPLAPDRYHAIQVGTFRNWEHACDLIEIFKGKGFDVYWISMERRNRGILYKVLVGRFMDGNEAAEFAKDKGILNDYPGSFILAISSSEIGH